MPEDRFIGDSVIDTWVRNGTAVRDDVSVRLSGGDELVLVDAIRVLGRRDGESDPYGLTGQVLSLRAVVDRGGTIHARGLRLGSATYDIEFGFAVKALTRTSAA